MDIYQYDIRLTRHALERAQQNNIDPGRVFSCIKTGELYRVGDNYIKFVKRFKKCTITCICQPKDDCIVIITVTKGKK
jgi:hypothetical protein